MMLFTHSVSRSLLDIQRADRATARLGRELNTGNRINSAADDPASWVEASRAQATATYLDAVHTGLHEAATVVHEVDISMGAIGTFLDLMKQQLVQALDRPAGDPNRDALLQNFNRIRQQIDSLVNTAGEGARKIMSDPAVDPQAGDLRVRIGTDGAAKTISARQVHTGATGLHIPAVAAGAANDEINSAVNNLDAANATLAARRAALDRDAQDLKRYQAGNTQISDIYTARGESLQIADPTETAAEMQSVDLRRALALQTLAGLTTARASLLGLLR
jgi:flagellin